MGPCLDEDRDVSEPCGPRGAVLLINGESLLRYGIRDPGCEEFRLVDHHLRLVPFTLRPENSHRPVLAFSVGRQLAVSCIPDLRRVSENGFEHMIHQTDYLGNGSKTRVEFHRFFRENLLEGVESRDVRSSEKIDRLLRVPDDEQPVVLLRVAAEDLDDLCLCRVVILDLVDEDVSVSRVQRSLDLPVFDEVQRFSD